MKSFLLLLICSVFGIYLQAQTQDTTIRKYFVCQSTNFFKISRIIKNGERILVKDTAYRKLRGQINIINDSLFVVRNSLTEVTDTFNINAITMVRKPTMFNNINSALAIAVGSAELALAAYLLEQNPTGIGSVFAVLFIATGTPAIANGLLSFNGKHYRSRHYHYKLVTTKGYRLKYKDIGTIR